MDEFSPPSEESRPPPVAAGRIDVGRACADGARAFARNLPALLAAMLLAFVVYLVSICTCVGWIVALPVLLWGLYALWLEAADGRADAWTILSGFRDLGHTWPRSTGVALLVLLVQSPVIAVGGAMSAYAQTNPEVLDPLLVGIGTQVLGLGWMLVVARLLLAPFAMVDRDDGVLQSFATSWEVTRGQWFPIVALFVIDVIAMLPGQMISLAASTRQPVLASPEDMLLLQGISLVGTALMMIGMTFGMLVVAAGWRQLVPDRSDLPG